MRRLLGFASIPAANLDLVSDRHMKRLSATIAAKHKFLSYTLTDMSVLASGSSL